jgi:hypothetical protein
MCNKWEEACRADSMWVHSFLYTSMQVPHVSKPDRRIETLTGGCYEIMRVLLWACRWRHSPLMGTGAVGTMLAKLAGPAGAEAVRRRHSPG